VLRLVLAAALLTAGACGSRPAPPQGPVVLDLLAALPATEAAPPTEVIAASDRRHLLQGWGALDSSDGEPRVWLRAGRGVAWFDAGRKPVPLTLRVSAIADAQRPHPVMVRLNQRMIGAVRPATGRTELQMALPAEAQRPGRNVLELITPGGRARQRGILRGRGFGVIALRFQRDAPPPAGPRADGRRLVLPGGSDVSWFVALPAGAALAWDGGRGNVRVSVEVDGAPARDVATIRTTTGGAADLGSDAGRLARLTLAAPAAAAEVEAPRLVGAPDDEPACDALPRGTNVVLYVADTVRADRLGLYGYGRPTSPRLDAFAREAVVFDDAVAQSSWTRPAVASLLTGRWPHQHGAVTLMSALRPDLPTLAELLRDRGYATAAFVTNLNVAGRFGFDRGFERFEYLPERDDRREVYVPAPTLHAAALAWLAERRERPFFLWLHATDTHAPYRPPADQAARFRPAGIAPTIDDTMNLRTLMDRPAVATADNVAYLSGLYDGEIAALDAAFGHLLDELRRRDLDRSTVVVFVSDHGEEFHDHGGLEHGRTLYRELTRVPLLVRLPGGAMGGRRSAAVARHIDLVPTLLALLHQPAPSDLPGRVLLCPPAGDVPALMATELAGRQLVGLARGPWRAVFDESEGRAALYDVTQDPGERRDLAGARPVVVGFARQAIARLRLEGEPTAAPTIADPETERRLRALGYLD
jgi:arylsulfatase A-like enzyme